MTTSNRVSVVLGVLVFLILTIFAMSQAYAARGPLGTPGHGGFVATSTKPITSFDPVVGPGFSVMRKGGGKKKGGKRFGG